MRLAAAYLLLLLTAVIAGTFGIGLAAIFLAFTALLYVGCLASLRDLRAAVDDRHLIPGDFDPPAEPAGEEIRIRRGDPLEAIGRVPR